MRNQNKVMKHMGGYVKRGWSEMNYTTGPKCLIPKKKESELDAAILAIATEKMNATTGPKYFIRTG